MATNGTFTSQEQFNGSATSASNDASATNNADLGKDEVGWYFVEQYYTTLSKTPEKLHLYYGKRSQFVSGREAQVANVSVGRQAIQERIKELNFQDCKVRISNVDSQASYDNIVIQVIGEISNKAGQEPKKFCQTFILAQQPSGYFVLNDMLRYIDEEVEAETSEAAAADDKPAVEIPPLEQSVAAPAPASDSSSELDTKVVDEKLAETANTGTNGGDTESEAGESVKTDAPAAADVDAAAAAVADEATKEAEKPQDPSPTPVAKPAAVAEAAPAEPSGPPKPMTWASRAAAAAGPRPVVPLPKTATPPAQSQSRAPAPAAAPAAASKNAPTPAATTASSAEPATKDGWQTAGVETKRQTRPQSVSAAPADKENTLGYVKFVNEKVQEAELKQALETHGELAYFDINRQKNCAFVEFKTPEGLVAALAASPHNVNGENIIVEPRRPKPSFGGNNFAPGSRGSQRGRGGFDGNRTGGRGDARGNFGGQGRGRGAARGRGGAQPANA